MLSGFFSLREIQRVSLTMWPLLSEACPLSRSQEPPLPTSPPAAAGSLPCPQGSLSVRTGFGLVSSLEKSNCPQTGEARGGFKFREVHLIFIWGYLLNKLWTGREATGFQSHQEPTLYVFLSKHLPSADDSFFFFKERVGMECCQELQAPPHPIILGS